MILLLNGCSKVNGPSTPSLSPEPTSPIQPTSAPTTQPTPTPVPTVTVAPSPTVSITSTPNQTEEALKLLNQMSLEEKVGQMFFVRCSKNTALADIKQYHLGGYILFADSFEKETKTSIKKTIASYQATSDVPMLIGVDEEGGTVNRVSKYPAFRSKPFQSPQELFQLGGYDLIVKDTIEKARLLRSLGINVNLAPVCDVSTNAADYIFKRSFGQNAQNTTQYVNKVVRTMNAQGIGCTLKHFPGYGNNVNTHTDIAIDNRDSDQFYSNDFLPFEAGINAGAGSILVSHNIVKAFDKDYPASLSYSVHSILREDLNFSGVIMTDDLSMDAIKKYTNNEEAAVLAVQAGNDLLIASDYSVQIPAVINAVKNDEISIEQINESVMRVLSWKLALGIIK
jgi:Beta-glucosidase-related glycosidases